jgi:hypothetical protein
MKLSRDKLKNIIKEELEEIMSEQPQTQNVMEPTPEVQLQNMLNTLKGRIDTLEGYKQKLVNNPQIVAMLQGEIEFLKILARVKV